MATDEQREFERTGGHVALWTGVLAGPIIWALHIQANYSLVRWTCYRGHHWTMHLISVVALLLTAGAAWLAWRNWQEAGGSWPSGKEGGLASRSRFMGALGLLMCVMFFLVDLAQWIPSFVLGPCQW